MYLRTMTIANYITLFISYPATESKARGHNLVAKGCETRPNRLVPCSHHKVVDKNNTLSWSQDRHPWRLDAPSEYHLKIYCKITLPFINKLKLNTLDNPPKLNSSFIWSCVVISTFISFHKLDLIV